MSPFNLMHKAIDDLRDLPGIWHLRKRKFDRRFENARRAHLFRGIYESFEAAAAAAPATRPHSYDNAQAAEMYDTRMRVEQFDYPALFWLARVIQDGARSIFDLGGHIGIKYYAFSEFLPRPDDLKWTVCDVPAVVDRGRKLASARGVDRTLRFTDRAADADGSDVIFASASLQYLPYTLADLISALENKPTGIIVNLTPLHPALSFFTLNAIGVAFCPYRVMSEGEFQGSLRTLGYRVQDQWKNIGKAMSLPFAEHYDVEAYSGAYFSLQQ